MGMVSPMVGITAPTKSNPDQKDSDGDGKGDICSGDRDK